MHPRVNAIFDPKTGAIIEQSPLPPFDTVAYGAGGAGGAAVIGAMEIMEEYGLRAHVTQVSGVSVGSIVALCDALGYTAAETKQLFLEMPTEEFLPMSESWRYTPEYIAKIADAARTLLRFRSSATLEGQKKFLSWLQEKIVAPKLGNGEATNLDLDEKIATDFEEKGSSLYKKLYVGVAKVSLDIPKLVVFGSDRKRKIGLAQMVLMSCCHPYLWGAIEWEGELWSDGGIRQLILMDIFDKEPFYHAKFCDMKVNPGVLGLKIYSQKEHDQLICGKEIREPVKSSSQLGMRVVTGALYNAIDPSEEHRPLNIIALSVGDIDRIKLNHPKEKLMELIESGRQDTLNYLENHMGLVHMTYHKNMAAWLQAPTTSLAAVKRAYLAMLVPLSGSTNSDDIKKSEAICSVINFIEDYRRQREEDDHWQDKVIDYPAHIDIPPAKHVSVWHEKIKESLMVRLDQLCGKIACFEREYQRLYQHYIYKLEEVMPEGNYGWRSEEALRILLCENYLDKLCAERNEMECKLGLKHDNPHQDDAENTKAYMQFFDEMHQLNSADELSGDLKVLRLNTLPFLTIAEEGVSPYHLQLDLRRSLDRNLYLIAAIIYLTYMKSNDLEKIKQLAKKFIPDCLDASTNIDAFISALGLKAVEVHTALFKLEAIIHHFEKNRYIGYAPVLEVDKIFKLAAGSFFAKPVKPISVAALAEMKGDEWEMKLKEQLSKMKNDLVRVIAERDRLVAILRDYLNITACNEPFQNGMVYFHGAHSEMLQRLAFFEELMKKWQMECQEIECQLRMNCSHKVKASESDHQAYATFYLKMVELNSDANLSHALRAVMVSLLPIAEFEDNSLFPFKFRFDFRDELDRKIYLIAALIYLEWRAYPDMTRFRQIYQMYIPGDGFSPKSYKELFGIVDNNHVATQLAMLRIESLLHCFDKNYFANPAYKSPLNLDELWGLPKISVGYTDYTIKLEKPEAQVSSGTELAPVYQLSEAHAEHEFVAPMNAYTDNHASDEEDSDDLITARALSRR